MNARVVLTAFASLVLLLPSPRGASAQEDKGEKPAEKEATVVQLRLRGGISEALPEQNPFGPSPLYFKGLLDIIRRASADPKVAAIQLKMESPEIGLAKVREVLGALKGFRAAGKKVYAFAETLGPVDILLASAANRIEVPESAMALLPGVRAESLYMKSFLERLGVRFLVTPVGEYKSAFENLVRDDMSPALREVLESIVETIYRSMIDILAENRGIPPENVAQAIDRGFLSAAELLELGLVDELAYEDHFWDDVKADLGADKLKLVTNYGRRAVEIDMQNPFALFKVFMEALSPPKKRVTPKMKVAVVYASGPILSGKNRVSPFGRQEAVGSETTVEALRAAAKDDSVKAIVLRIDSPGGSGVASDAIWRAVMEARKRKPVVASMSDVAASGGYYIAMGANRILAEPETLTGSIGVIGALINLRGTLDLLGIRVESVSRGENSGVFSPFIPPDEVRTEPLRKLLEGFYWQFVDKAAAGRGKTRLELHEVAQGRVWMGRDALERGLVDELGGLDRAVAVARELAGVPATDELEMLELPEPPNFFEVLSEAFGVSLLSRIAPAGLAGLDVHALAAAPELRAILDESALLLELAQEPLLLLTPVAVRLE